MKRPKLLCVDDDPGMRELYQQLLGSHGYEVIVTEDGHQALAILRSQDNQIDAVISDYEMPGMNGAELAAELKHCSPTLPVIMMSGCTPTLEEAPHFVDAAFAKGTSILKMVDQIEALLAAARQRRVAIPLSGLVHLGSAVAMAVPVPEELEVKLLPASRRQL